MPLCTVQYSQYKQVLHVYVCTHAARTRYGKRHATLEVCSKLHVVHYILNSYFHNNNCLISAPPPIKHTWTHIHLQSNPPFLSAMCPNAESDMLRQSCLSEAIGKLILHLCLCCSNDLTSTAICMHSVLHYSLQY